MASERSKRRDFLSLSFITKLHLIKEIQISRQMTIYGQTLGVLKRKNNECRRNEKKTNLHKTKL